MHNLWQGAGAFAAMGAQFMGVAMGGNSFGSALANSVSITLDSFIPIPVARFNPADNPAAWLVELQRLLELLLIKKLFLILLVLNFKLDF